MAALDSSDSSIGQRHLRAGSTMIAKLNACLVRELNKVDNEGEKSAKSIDSMYQTTQ